MKDPFLGHFNRMWYLDVLRGEAQQGVLSGNWVGKVTSPSKTGSWLDGIDERVPFIYL